MHKKTISYVISIALALIVGSASALLTSDSMDIYSSVQTPPLSPPSIVFPIVWTILFTLMGISAARIYIANDYQFSSAIIIYAVQLAMNFAWSLIFFNGRYFLFAFIWLLVLWALILTMIIKFYRIDKTAALLQIPYLLWVTFAGYLNLGIYLLNR